MALLTIVTFIDCDGDEFPVGLRGDWRFYTQDEAEHAAREQLNVLIAEDKYRPNGNLECTGIEYPTLAPVND